MEMRLLVLSCGLALAAGQVVAQDHEATPPDSATASISAGDGESADINIDAVSDDEDYEAISAKRTAADITLFDSLRNEGSPRRQVLAGRIYVDNDDTPSVLRPKRADVVARAAQFAPDDAFVQWEAADQGSYSSSRCGPTRRPEAEVANLVRLESDNAVAWQFAFGLAQARNDQTGVDEALSRMASAARADDHLGEETAAWTQIYAAHPDASPLWGQHEGEPVSPAAAALLRGLEKSGWRSVPVESELAEACKPDGSSERAWQRLAWCSDAGRLYATRGNSFALRDAGLKMLAASGQRSNELPELQRGLDWLKTQAANPMQNFLAHDAPELLLADWKGAPNEIVATEHRLKRLGQPLTPPPGWVSKNRLDSEESSEKMAAVQKSYAEYLRNLVDSMRSSTDPRERALALVAGETLAAMTRSEDAAKAVSKSEAAMDPLMELVAANPDNLLVQWIAANSSETVRGSIKAQTTAIANLQRLDADNAAAAALAFAKAEKGSDSTAILQRMATGKRYDEHTAELLTVALAAVQRQPVPTALADSLRAASPMPDAPAQAVAQGIAMMMSSMVSSSAAGAIHGACSANKTAPVQAAHKDACVAVATLMLREGRTLIATTLGENLLRSLNALDPADAQRARHLNWWSSTLNETLYSNSKSLDLYFSDIATTGSEVEAFRLAAERAGKAEPPANWKSPEEKQAAKKARVKGG